MKTKIIALIDLLLDWRFHLLILIILLSSCETTSVTRGFTPRYYYDFEECPWPDTWIETVNENATFLVLPWDQFQKAAWANGYPNPRAFMKGWTVWLPEGYQLDSLFHEIGHIWRNDGGHDSPCWTTSRPWGYDEIVINQLEGIEI